MMTTTTDATGAAKITMLRLYCNLPTVLFRLLPMNTYTQTKGTMEAFLNVFTLHKVESKCLRETR